VRKPIICVDLFLGDCGKATFADYLSRKYYKSLMVRFSGSCNAAHNVVDAHLRHHEFKSFPCGMLIPNVKGLLSKHVLVEPLALDNENRHLKELGILDAYERLFVDERCLLITPFHVVANRLSSPTGSTTGMGLGVTVDDSIKYPDKIITIADILTPQIKNKLIDTRDRLASKFNYDDAFDIDVTLITKLYARIATKLNILSDSNVNNLLKNENLIFEGSQGALLDERFGFAPDTTWAKTTKHNALEVLDDAEILEHPITVGITRTYGTRHGNGIFPTFNDVLTSQLKDIHNNDFGLQGKFRCGWLDLPLLKYGILANDGVDCLAVSHIDKLHKYTEWKVNVKYSNNFLDNLPKDLAEQEELSKKIQSAELNYKTFHNTQILSLISKELNLPIMLESNGMTCKDKVDYFDS
jgi:adenylosuccinate synthase